MSESVEGAGVAVDGANAQPTRPNTTAEWLDRQFRMYGLGVSGLRETVLEVAAERDRLRRVLGEITDPSYVGNYSEAEVIAIYRKWAANALG